MCTKSGALYAKRFNQNSQPATYSSSLFYVPAQLILFGLVALCSYDNPFIAFAEEPSLGKAIGADYFQYCKKVRGWF